jgi:hypothetical protein
LHAVINSSADFYGSHRPNGNAPLVCIPVPKLPDIDSLHIDKRKTGELAVALFDWLMHGNRENPLLHSKTLQSGKEALAKQYSKQLAEKKQLLKTLEDRSSHSYDSARERKRALRDENDLVSLLSFVSLKTVRLRPRLFANFAIRWRMPSALAPRSYFHFLAALALIDQARSWISWIWRRTRHDHSPKTQRLVSFVQALFFSTTTRWGECAPVESKPPKA